MPIIGVIRDQLRRQKGQPRMGRSQKDQREEEAPDLRQQGPGAARHGDRRQRHRPSGRQGTAVPARAHAPRDRHRLGRLRLCRQAGDLGEDVPRHHHQDGEAPAGREGVRRPPAQGVVERSWSWIMRARRHCRDHERLPEMSESLITWAAITLMTRRLTRAEYA
ncbi:transposase [Streptomyces lunaelactis]|nr:transposase [Streptomyces lunaelactis]NUK41718.1 transposase [Streptomyces lunaelactis]